MEAARQGGGDAQEGCCLSLSCKFFSQTHAATVDIDLSQVGQSFRLSGPCYCESIEYLSQVFSVNSGDVVDFGTLVLYPSWHRHRQAAAQINCPIISKATPR
jgi:hypothetical protein